MGRYKVLSGQNLYDVALHLYGSIEGVVDLLIDNPELSFDTTLAAGRELLYTDGFVINADVVAYNELHGIIPANGERKVYPKTFTRPLAAVFSLSAELIHVYCSVSGTGVLEIDWGDNSDAERVVLTDQPRLLAHTFDNKVRGQRRVRWYTDACFRTIDWSGLQPQSVVLLDSLPVEELTLKNARLALTSLRLLSGTYHLDLSGCTPAALTPLVDCRGLKSLDLSYSNLKPALLDEYLLALVARYGTRRNCTVSLPATPTGNYREPERDAASGRYRITSGMEAVWVILHEEAWNEGGAWKFIIDDKTYTTE